MAFDIAAYYDLDRLALEAEADKGSFYHNYTKIYSQYFAPIRNQNLKILEIGVWQGASVRLWEGYFPNADLHFIDIDYSHLTYMPSRAHLHICDQSNVSQLKSFVQKTGGDWDIIIDDGGHTMEQQQVSFKTLFPYLRSGGMYIIEDLHTSYWKEYGGKGGQMHPAAARDSTTEFLKRLIDDINYVGARTAKANHDTDLHSISSELTGYRNKILSLTFYDSLCIIVKR